MPPPSRGAVRGGSTEGTADVPTTTVKSRSTSKKASSSSASSAVVVPEYDWKVTGAPAFAQLHVTLKAGQEILSSGGALAYMREGVDRGVLDTSGGIAGFFSKAVVGEGLHVSYKGLPDVGGRALDRTVTFSAGMPGDILSLSLKTGQAAIVSREAYLAGSPTVRLTAQINAKGLISFGDSGEDFILPRLSLDAGAKSGTFWLGAYGAITKHVLETADDTLTVDNGLFLAVVGNEEDVKNNSLYTTVTLGKTLTSSFLGGEGLGIQFTGPHRVVYTQSHNLNELAAAVGARLPSSSSKSGGASSSPEGRSKSVKKIRAVPKARC